MKRRKRTPARTERIGMGRLICSPICLPTFNTLAPFRFPLQPPHLPVAVVG